MFNIYKSTHVRTVQSHVGFALVLSAYVLTQAVGSPHRHAAYRWKHNTNVHLKYQCATHAHVVAIDHVYVYVYANVYMYVYVYTPSLSKLMS